MEGEYGNTPLISSKGEDGGIFDFYNIEPFYNKPFITIPRVGTIGVAFVQTKPCCVDDHLLILIPKKAMATEELYQIAFQLRCNIWMYKYGRGITPDRIKKQEIILCEIKKKYKDYKENRKYTKIKELKEKEIPNAKLFKLSDICNIEKKNALPQNAINLDSGGTPYITTTSKNNGVSNFTDEEANSKANCLTVAMNESVCEVFYQNKDFITSGDNAALYLKEEYRNLSEKQKYALLFYIGVFIKNEKWKYNYYRKLSKEKLSNIKIYLPKIEYIENLYNDILS